MIAEISKTTPKARIEALVSATGGKGEFVQSLVAQFTSKGHLSDKQWHWVEKLTGEKAAPAQAKAEIFAPGVWVAFNAAAHLDNEWPSVQIKAGAGRAKLLLCKGSKGPYLKVSYTEATKPRAADWTFVAIAIESDLVTPRHKAQGFDDVLEALSMFGEDMLGALAAFGKAFVICGCCGRSLAHPASVALAIGPVCSSRLGLGAQWRALAVELTGSDKIGKGE
jgi:hypothetical protein